MWERMPTAGVEFQVRKGLMDTLRSNVIPCGNGGLSHSFKSGCKRSVLHVRETTHSGDSREHGWSPGAEEAVQAGEEDSSSETTQEKESVVLCQH